MIQAARDFELNHSKPETGSHIRLNDQPDAYSRKVSKFQFGNIRILPLTRKISRPISSAIKEFQESTFSKSKRSFSIGITRIGPSPIFKR